MNKVDLHHIYNLGDQKPAKNHQGIKPFFLCSDLGYFWCIWWPCHESRKCEHLQVQRSPASIQALVTTKQKGGFFFLFFVNLRATFHCSFLWSTSLLLLNQRTFLYLVYRKFELLCSENKKERQRGTVKYTRKWQASLCVCVGGELFPCRYVEMTG